MYARLIQPSVPRFPSPPPSPCQSCRTKGIDRTHSQCKHFGPSQPLDQTYASQNPDCASGRQHHQTLAGPNQRAQKAKETSTGSSPVKDLKDAKLNRIAKRAHRRSAVGNSVLHLAGGYKFRVNVPRFVDRTNRSDPRHPLQTQLRQHDADSSMPKKKRKRHEGDSHQVSSTPPSSPRALKHQENPKQEKSQQHGRDGRATAKTGSSPWSVLTPFEYKTAQSEESSWQVTVSADFERLLPAVVSADMRGDITSNRPKPRGRPPKAKFDCKDLAKSHGSPSPRLRASVLPSPPRELEPHHSSFSALVDLTLNDQHLIKQPFGPNDTAGTCPWTLSKGPTGISINFHIESANVMRDVIQSLLESLSASQLDPSGPTTPVAIVPHQIRFVINRHLLDKYGSRTYSYGGTASSCISHPKLISDEASSSTTSSPDTPRIEFTFRFDRRLYQESSLSHEQNVLSLVECSIEQYLECGNVFHPFLHRKSFQVWFRGLQRPMHHPLVISITAAWVKHTCTAHPSSDLPADAPTRVKTLEGHLKERAFTLFEDSFDCPTYETLCTLSILLLFAEKRHEILHALAARIINSLDLMTNVVSVEREGFSAEQETNGEELLLATMTARGDGSDAEMRRRVWWDWYYNDNCCRQLAGAGDHDFDTLRLPRPLPDEDETDAAGVHHFAAKCAWRAIHRRVARTVENVEGTVTEGEIHEIEETLKKWRERLPGQVRLDNDIGTTVVSSISVWPFYLATELELKYQSALMVLHRLFLHKDDPVAQSIAVCVHACDVIVALLQARQQYKFCRSNVHTFMEVCDTLVDVLAVGGADTEGGKARRTLARALQLIQNTRAYQTGSYDQSHHFNMIEDAKKFGVESLEVFENEDFIWYRPNVDGLAG
ncbi:hypothetical protein BC937DRAFT_90246 [Endogone sp. FLAS-F59071]|nr:hypothetical protein BC937DRAFT_90246 [Endogone sp. FLAS-F59071]|eukprot:RUS17225.1 hypothetical protein BC937DRAFT_90246 [Endogone sp. FLAS-F59071]